MREVLVSLGASDQITGLANIGALIGLAIYAVVLVRWIWRRRAWFTTSWRRWRRSKALRQLKAFRHDQRLRRRGASELFIIWQNLWKIFMSISSMILNLGVCLINLLMYQKSGNDLSLFVSSASGMFVFMKSLDVINLGDEISAKFIFQINRGIALEDIRQTIRETRSQR